MRIVEIFAVLDDAAARIAAEAASAAEAKSADADTPPVKIPETTPAPIEPAPPTPRTRPSIAQAKSTQVALRSVFERVLSVFETSGFTDTEVLSQLKRLLLATGASPTMLLEALRRRQLFEPLPEHAHAQVLGLLNEVLGQTEAQIQEPDMLEQTHPARFQPRRSTATSQRRRILLSLDRQLHLNRNRTQPALKRRQRQLRRGRRRRPRRHRVEARVRNAPFPLHRLRGCRRIPF